MTERSRDQVLRKAVYLRTGRGGGGGTAIYGLYRYVPL